MNPATLKQIGDVAQNISIRLSGAWSVVGPLFGVLLGALLTGRNQRVKWIADSKKEEYRELLTTLVAIFMKLEGQILPSTQYSSIPTGPRDDIMIAR
jgi:hypothetical protein